MELVGRVPEHTPPSKLVISWVNRSQESDLQAQRRVTLDMAPYDGMTNLTMSHEDLIKGSGLEQGVSKGWPIELPSLKSSLETDTGLSVFARPRAA